MADKHDFRIPGWEAALILLSMLAIIGVSLVSFGADPHVPILFIIMGLIVWGKLRRFEWKSIENGMVKGVQSGIVPVIIFLLIGVLIAVWMKSGTIPTLITYSFNIISVDYFLVSVFIVTSIIAVFVGSSFTTVSTIGVAFIAIATALDVNLAMAAGAIVSGAMFGDKMSPMSDTTNLASSVSQVDLFEHIRHMLWTTIPAFVITALAFVFLKFDSTQANISQVESLIQVFQTETTVHWIAIVPALLMLLAAVKKLPAIPTILLGIVSGFLASLVLQVGSVNISEWMTVVQAGFETSTGNEQVDSIINRGGIQSMMWAVSLLLLALSMGGMLSELNVINSLMAAIHNWVETRGKAVLSTVLTGIGINLTLGEQYMSVILPGEAYASRYQEMGYEGKHLSKVLESSGTVINPLIPYGVSGVFMASVLGVPVLSYLPFAFFCLLCPIITIIYGFTGISMKRQTEVVSNMDPSVSSS
ncbi:Na+/H+ antiporter NhaC [Alkalibacillus salilacus]|uniref:NhaC family Na+:H+ antiporter n=1 Tax=Alkalibacillus salilacus TaxID=284582 RepID=A0ABT9VF18_9BACI|nr:Na+/H+ antiporter NhaC [Alkalibacillus salilacus]MDQ0159455.1 NhaC family Na+:H+ antiporter [Alkalibacillus salilacus]